MDHRSRFRELQTLLETLGDLWRPAPFHVRKPGWCDQRPELEIAVRTLDDARLEHFRTDPTAASSWLAPYLPELDGLQALCVMPRLPERALPAIDAHLDWAVPGRKREQIEAFVSRSPKHDKPLLEWCSGKGHLGRHAALRDRVPVTSLELDPVLCEQAGALATRAGLAQTVVCEDALSANAQSRVRDHTVLALHACGELHRSLVRNAPRAGAHAYRIAPCCYHRGAGELYEPLNPLASLALDGRALRLAVTELVTAPGRDRRRLARDQAWKLGFIALRNSLQGEAERSFKPIPPDWLRGDFPSFCSRIASREALDLPGKVDWQHWENEGLRRRDEMARLELVRHAFRRPLEIWLALDICLALEQAGFAVTMGSFCERSLTPRNLMVLADPAA
jgi:hypothetical protein